MTRKAKIAGVVCASVLLGVLAAVLVWGRFSRARDDGYRPTIGTNLKQLGIAVRMYHETHGSLPYDPRGQEYAMYLLKHILEIPPGGWAHLFLDPDFEYPEPFDARFDEERSMVVGSQVDYLNEPAPPEDDRIVVFAEKPIPGKDKRSFVTWAGRTASYVSGTGAFDGRPLVGLKWTGERLVQRQFRLEEQDEPTSPRD